MELGEFKKHLHYDEIFPIMNAIIINQKKDEIIHLYQTCLINTLDKYILIMKYIKEDILLIEQKIQIFYEQLRYDDDPKETEYLNYLLSLRGSYNYDILDNIIELLKFFGLHIQYEDYKYKYIHSIYDNEIQYKMKHINNYISVAPKMIMNHDLLVRVLDKYGVPLEIVDNVMKYLN